MRVLHIIDSCGMYGAEIMLLNLMSEQVKMGLEPILASIGEPAIREKMLETEAANLGLRVRAFRILPGPNFAGALTILRYARQEGVDLLHSHGYKGNIFFGLLPKLVRGLPLVSTVHGWTWTGGISRMMLYERLDALALSGADRIVLVSEQMLHHPRLRSTPLHKLVVVENGIAENDDRDGLGLDERIIDFCGQGITIGAIGRLSREKGLTALLETVASLAAQGRDIRLVVLGEGGGRNDLESMTGTLGIEGRVLLPGYVREAKRYLAFFSIFAMPSLTEGLPIVLLEAMQAGVPIVATRVGGIPGVLNGGECGYLIEPDSCTALERGILDVMDNPREAAKRVHKARQRVIDTYSSRIMAEKYGQVYRDILC